MSNKEIIRVVKKDQNITAEEILRKIYEALDPKEEQRIIEAVEFPNGINSNKINIKLSNEADDSFVRFQLKNISEIALKN